MWVKEKPVYYRDEALAKYVWEYLHIKSLHFNPACKVWVDVKGKNIRFIIATKWDFGFEHYAEWELQDYQNILTERIEKEVKRIKNAIKDKLDVESCEFKLTEYKESDFDRKGFLDYIINKENYDNIMVLLKMQGLDVKW